ncbi:Basement membrane-specific heparan sulfate proteoglycan core protein [Phytophthora pseudosyringae]|uniref:Basement membrane-specific heparan sulfate proteoglycan core protein n=1 Tax=Phytophthora pseudosyringae TaxID=221518 RepID=A0A8T1VJG5_9STRA|nr:Basement membrane-specific heparan sulfate proteoglycan core protein [Phytophthora pseudosyringae]
MPAIAPSPAIERDAPGRVVAGLAGIWTRIAIFVGRLPGQASVSKLDALERFQLETSPWRVALILVLTPLPWLLINLLLEWIPLRDPADGFWGSGYYQLRMLLTSTLSSVAPVLLKLHCVPGFPASSPRVLAAYALFQAAICLGTNAIIALAADVFPVPFSQFTVILPMAIGGRLVLYRRVPDDPQLHALSDKVNQWLGMETLPILVYPVFTAVFTVLTPAQQLWASLLLPVLKLGVRGSLWSVAKEDDDLVGVITCCVGHLYHILFTAMILQNAKSLETLAVVVLFNSVQMLFNCRCILADSNAIYEARAEAEGKEAAALNPTDNVRTALNFAQEKRIAQNLHCRTPSLLLSTYPGYRGAAFLEQNQEMLTLYNAANVYNSPTKAARRGPHSNVGAPKVIAVRQASAASRSSRISRILPWADRKRQVSDQTIHVKLFVSRPRSCSDPSAWTNAEKEEGRLARHEAVIHKVASALHQTEMILLRSYVTVCMTLFYVIYLQAVFHLSNRRYFATLVYLTTIEAVDTTMQRLLLICAMEIFFLSIYLVLIWRRLGVSGVYQLAFILWSQKVLVQAKLYVTVVILGFPLTHNGNDSILRFRSF